jgi:hypothetical protein
MFFAWKEGVQIVDLDVGLEDGLVDVVGAQQRDRQQQRQDADDNRAALAQARVGRPDLVLNRLGRLG